MHVKNINSLRALFGADLAKNAVHGSSDPDKAKDAIKMIFGDVKLDAVLSKSPPIDGLFQCHNNCVIDTSSYMAVDKTTPPATDGENATTAPGKCIMCV